MFAHSFVSSVSFFPPSLTFTIKGHKAGTDKWARGKPIRHLDPALLIRKITGKGVISPRLRSILLVLAARAKAKRAG